MWDVSDEALVAGVAAGRPGVAAVLVGRFQPIGTVRTRLRTVLGQLRDVLAGVPA